MDAFKIIAFNKWVQIVPQYLLGGLLINSPSQMARTFGAEANRATAKPLPYQEWMGACEDYHILLNISGAKNSHSLSLAWILLYKVYEVLEE